ncbi:sigma-70 family RNA polymerase sigma factor [Bacillus sp. AFS017336]|uniref:sigma-70 family RNA polymerase sigma factor n=1 Tax=Bacillus sp. AFS017336 TaxID=2033489 RepID=UPI0015CF03B6|nr:sigma-70 family RNA polymerase sigma factor [Bacillus sp. AFS017336]
MSKYEGLEEILDSMRIKTTQYGSSSAILPDDKYEFPILPKSIERSLDKYGQASTKTYVPDGRNEKLESMANEWLEQYRPKNKSVNTFVRYSKGDFESVVLNSTRLSDRLRVSSGLQRIDDKTISKVLRLLPKESHREYIRLYWVEGLNQDQIAESLGVSQSNVSQTLNFIVIKMKSFLLNEELRKLNWKFNGKLISL